MLRVEYETDIAIVGGSTHAVSAAVAAAREGARVFLAAPRPYLGEDLCATLRLRLQAGQRPETDLARRIFADGRRTTPLRVKRVLDEALVEAGVEFLFGCYATEVLRDEAGRLRGFVVTNRAGRQAVLAGAVIDATAEGWFAQTAGAERRPWPGGSLSFERTVVLEGEGGEPRFVSREVRVEMPDRSFASFAAAEQAARGATYTEGQLRASERLFHVPPDPFIGRRTASRWSENGENRLGHFRPAGTQGLFVLSGCADVPREAARRLLRPTGLMAVGETVGKAAAREAYEASEAGPVRVSVPERARREAVGVRERTDGARPTGEPAATVESDAASLPVMGNFDVVVVGGGTTGAPAAIAAGRRGASVLVVEYQPALGGTATLGLIGKPYHGERVGFSHEVPFPDEEHNLEHKMEWYRRSVRAAGGEVWFGAMGCGLLVEDGATKGVVVATPAGRGVVRADAVIDATGNADLAAAAGLETTYGATEADRIAMQGAGLPERSLGSAYVNTDYLLIDESDMVDVWRALVGVRLGMEDRPFDVGPLIQTRERRRVVGEHVLRYLDQVCGPTYADSVVRSSSDYDSHGYPNHPYFALMPHTPESRRANHPAPGGSCYTPYRCLLPKGLDGLLVVGLGISMERDAAALVRMQHDLANQGYAAGVAAAVAVEEGIGLREIDVRRLQEHLVEVGNLPPEVLEHEDSFPLPGQEVGRAAREVTDDDRMRACRALAVVLTQPGEALSHLKAAYREADGADRLFYGKLLAFLGQREAVPELIAALCNAQWDEKILQGGMAEYAHLPTPVDALVLALGHSHDPRALPVIFEKMEELDADSTLSHHRAAALALEEMGDPAAAEPLARLLKKPGMWGHEQRELEPLHREREKRRREGPLREIVLARALYRCGDHRGIGRQTLERYLGDLRGLFARHAGWVLERGPGGGCERRRSTET
ncbi:MAG: FAD-dependent oxidoreductase [Planctomycetota bacterium]